MCLFSYGRFVAIYDQCFNIVLIRGERWIRFNEIINCHLRSGYYRIVTHVDYLLFGKKQRYALRSFLPSPPTSRPLHHLHIFLPLHLLTIQLPKRNYNRRWIQYCRRAMRLQRVTFRSSSTRNKCWTKCCV